jgi:aminopeptidase N
LDAWELNVDFLADLRGKIDVLLLFSEESYGKFSEEMLRDEMLALVNRFKKDRHEEVKRDLQQKIAVAEMENDKDKLLELLSAQQKLLSKS